MAEKEKAIFDSGSSFVAFIYMLFAGSGIIACIIYFHVNPMGFSVVIFLILCALFFGADSKIVVYQDRFLVVQKRVIDSMDGISTYYYQDIEKVEFRPDNISWINGFLYNRGGTVRAYDKFLVFFRQEGKAASIDVNCSRSKMRTAESIINDHIKRHLTHHHHEIKN